MATRVVPTKIHGVIDYVTAPTLLATPDVLGLNGGRASALAPRVAGASAAAYSALTDYELGVRRLIPMRVHLLLDGVSGAALASVPWLSGSWRRGVKHWLPHALVGAAEVGLALTTRTTADDEKPAGRFARLTRAATSTTAGRAAIGAAAAAVVTGVVVGQRRRSSQVEELDVYTEVA
jgi:hypothetical protein